MSVNTIKSMLNPIVRTDEALKNASNELDISDKPRIVIKATVIENRITHPLCDLL